MNKQAAKYKISPRGKRKLDYPSKPSKSSVKLPLIGKTIFLDVKDAKHQKRLQQDLKKLGATLEEFVSRDINYLITSQPRPRNKVASPCGDENPSPSPFNCDPSPSPGYPEDKKVTSVTRGKALAEKARYTRQTSTLLDNAEKWGVKIVSIEGAFKWIDKELKKLPKSAGNLSKKSSRTKCVSSYKIIKAPYVKLEGGMFCYRPFHLELDVWPRLNVDTPRGSCPFDGTQIKGGDESREERGELLAAQVDIPSEDTPKEEKDGSESAVSTPRPSADKTGKKSESDVFSGSKIMTAGELKRRKDLKRKQERKRGYCECCHVKYEDLDKHVKEDQHRQYVKDKANYQQLDTLITSGQSTQNFLFEYLAKAAKITSMRNSSSNKMASEDAVRRSPRKAVQEMTIKSLCKSPRKFTQQLPVQSMKSPRRSTGTVAQTVRVSPRKNLQKLNNIIGNLDPKPPVASAELTKISPSSRTRRNSEGKKRADASPSPNVHVSVTGNIEATGSRTPNTRKQQSTLQKENMMLNSHENGMDNCPDISKVVKDISKNSVSECRRSLNKDLEKSPCKTLSPVNLNSRVLSKSPMRKDSLPRKQLTESIEQEKCMNDSNVCEGVNKENVSPLKKGGEKTVDQKPSHVEDKIKQIRSDNTEVKQTDDEIITSHNRKFRGKSVCSEKTVKDLVVSLGEETPKSCDQFKVSLIDSSEMDVSSDALHADYELTKAGFTEIVRFGKKRTQVEHSSDDFEVCFARSLDNEILPELMNTEEIIEKTFDGMVVQCEKVGKTNKSSDAVSVHKSYLTENETDVSTSKTRRSPRKKSKNATLLNKSGSRKNVPLKQSQKNTCISTENDIKNAEKDKDVFDLDEQSDIPSDFQCYDKGGKLLTFSKTLAERIKERSVGRRTSVESYNMNVLFQLPSRSRSNSFSSNHSDKTSNTVTETKKNKNGLKQIERKRSGSSLASAKVVNKYRNRRIGLKQDEKSQIGYQGDDENELTPILSNLTRSHVIPKKPRGKFWDYEPITEKAEMECDEKLTGLPKELKNLKTSCSWFSSDNSDSESRRARTRIHRKDDMELKQIKSLNNKHQVDQLEEIDTLDKAINESDKIEERKDSGEAVKSSNCEEKSRNAHEHLHHKDVFTTNTGRKTSTKRNRFWYYKTEHNEGDSEKDIETKRNLPRELRDLKTSINSEIQTESRRASKVNDSIDEYLFRTTNKTLQGRLNEQEECIADKTKERNAERKVKGKSIQDLAESNEDSFDDTKKVKSKSRKKGEKYWHFVEEAIDDLDMEEEKYILKNLPKELRLLKDAWNSDQILSKNERRKSKAISENDEAEDTCSGENLEQKVQEAVKQKQEKMCENNGLNASASKEIQCTRGKARKKYWDIVVVEERSDEEENRDLPSELRALKFSKADNFGNEASNIEKQSRVRDRKNHVSSYVRTRELRLNNKERSIAGNLRKRESKVNYRENDYTETESEENEPANNERVEKKKSDRCSGKLYEYRQKSKVDYRESDITDTESDVGNERDTFDFKNQPESYKFITTVDGSVKNNTGRMEAKGCSEKGIRHTEGKAKPERRKFWDHVTEVIDEVSDKHEHANLPKELRMLEETYVWPSGYNTNRRSRSSSRVSDTEKSGAPEILCRMKKMETVDSIESKVNESEDSHQAIGKLEDANDVVIEKTSEERTNCPEKDTAENSDSERSRSRSIKRKVFWDYKVVAEEDNTVEVDKSLPKELQILKNTWNDLSTVERRRSRSCRSRSDVSDIENIHNTAKAHIRKTEDSDDDDDEEVVLINEEISGVTKSKTKDKRERKVEIQTNNFDESKSVTVTDNFSVQEDSRKSGTLSNCTVTEKENDRSTSPVFNVIQSCVHKVRRRKSPVFNRSPRQLAKLDRKNKECLADSKKEHRHDKMKSRKYVVKGKSVKPRKLKVVNDSEAGGSSYRQVEDYCSDSEEESGRNGQKYLEDDSVSFQVIKTPEKSIPAVEPGSGYSNTPRENRRKQWKRKNIESDSTCTNEKKRKLGYANISEDSRVDLIMNSPNKSTPKRRLIELDVKDSRDNERCTMQTDSYITKQTTEHAGHENAEDKFALTWTPVGSEKGESKCGKVKLNKSWTMLSKRSVTKLLSSEDDNENFDGFTDEDTLPSDMSYEERSEVEIPNDDKHEWVLEDEEQSENEENLGQLVPVFFPSPNKTSNSSWNDAIEGYIDNSIKHGPESSFQGDSSTYFNFNYSPRKSPLKQSGTSSFNTLGVVKSSKLQSPVKVHRPCTPKRKRGIQMHSPEIERVPVDNEIEFNFGSPQKNRSQFSPLKTVNGVVKSLSNIANLTSTPVSKKSKKQKHRK